MYVLVHMKLHYKSLSLGKFINLGQVYHFFKIMIHLCEIYMYAFFIRIFHKHYSKYIAAEI